MLSWTFGFWSMLGMLFISYHLGGLVADVNTVRDTKKNKPKVVPVDIERVGEIWYAFESETKIFLAQAISYSDLQKKLADLSNHNYVMDSDKYNALMGDIKDDNRPI